MAVLDSTLSAQLRQLLTNLRHPIELRVSLDDSPASAKVEALTGEIAQASELVSVVATEHDLTPSFGIARAGEAREPVRFAGLPLGHEFSSLVLALLHVGGHPAKISEQTRRLIAEIEPSRELTTFMSLTCTNCPDVVQALTTIAALNPGVSHLVIEGSTFRDLVEERGVMAVPSVWENGELIHSGRADCHELAALLAGDSPREPVREAAPFDVLVVGAGPAGTSAAVYAARKGIRVGVVAGRVGGQVLDTDAIENHIPLTRTSGREVAQRMREHLSDYDIWTHTPAEAVALTPGEEYHEVALSDGTVLKARRVIIATGASWRTLGVAGEEEYRNHGVSFCPHCDGPFFAGKRVAVIGGGNSGVEAALDLAGIVEHVTLIEFLDELKADAVLVDAARARENIDIVTGARTEEISGDGSQVKALSYTDRASGQTRTLALDGVFVQIGLIPQTAWLEGALEINDRGEIVVDERGATSVPGVYAAGDVTDGPYKQIVVAYGQGAAASLGAFDSLLREA